MPAASSAQRPRPVPQRWSARLLGLTLALLPLAGGANPEPLRLRVVGGLAGVNQYTRHEAPFWTQTLARISQGAFSADIVPFDRAGIRGQDMLRLIQLGTIPFGTALVSRSQTLDPELGAADLAGMNTDAAALRRRVAAFRPHLASMVRERHGAELLAVYAYPAQMMFCARPFGSLSELAGRRVRVANASQAELMRGLGALPVTTEFAEVVSSVRAGHVDCAITGSMSGNTIGLHEVTTHIHPLPISWGLSMFLANSAAWQALPAAARELLQRELPRLEAAIWEESERETADGLACNLGRPTCAGGRAGSMRLVESASDAARLRELFASAVLPGWVRRCGAGCTRLWNEHLAPLTGVQAPAP